MPLERKAWQRLDERVSFAGTSVAGLCLCRARGSGSNPVGTGWFCWVGYCRTAMQLRLDGLGGLGGWRSDDRDDVVGTGEGHAEVKIGYKRCESRQEEKKLLGQASCVLAGSDCVRHASVATPQQGTG